MIKKILIAFAAILAGLLVLVAMQPDSYTVTRKAVIDAPPERVFSLVNDFHEWDKWSPWAKIDPNMKATYDGAPAGTGAIYSWTGNDEVGEGRMTILDSQSNSQIKINLEFLKPFESKAITDFSFKPGGGGTEVAWVMTGDSSFMSKAVSLAMGGMDKMIGPDFEKGLAQMKTAAEAN
ncbi:MAG: SRPBCC family protein [Bryobacteraceae bacterium]